MKPSQRKTLRELITHIKEYRNRGCAVEKFKVETYFHGPFDMNLPTRKMYFVYIEISLPSGKPLKWYYMIGVKGGLKASDKDGRWTGGTAAVRQTYS